MNQDTPELESSSDRRRRGASNRARFALLALVLTAVGGAAAMAGASSYAQGPGEVMRVRTGGGPEETRLVIELDRAVAGRMITDAAPQAQIVVALPGVRAGDALRGGGQGLIRSWKIESAAGAARLDVALTAPGVVKRRFLLPPDDGVAFYRYVVDFVPASGRAPAAPQPVRPAAPPTQATARPAAPQTALALQRPAVNVTRVVVIDPGHGGKDPGATNEGAAEKDLALDAARELRAALLRTGHYQVVMTRDSDQFVPLEQRMQIARREHADLFISLHVNSISDPSLHGATVYTLSEKGVDRVARKVFAGNGDWFINVDQPTRDVSVNRILLDLTQRETTNQSTKFANVLLDRMSGRVDLLRRSHRDANFMVLLAPDVPAVLLEMGFITNPVDQERLSSPDQRKVLASAITEAIDNYFTHVSRLAAR